MSAATFTIHQKGIRNFRLCPELPGNNCPKTGSVLFAAHRRSILRLWRTKTPCISEVYRKFTLMSNNLKDCPGAWRKAAGSSSERIKGRTAGRSPRNDPDKPERRVPPGQGWLIRNAPGQSLRRYLRDTAAASESREEKIH